MGNTGDEFFPVFFIALLGFTGAFQLAAHVVKSKAGPAQFIAECGRHGIVEIAFFNFCRCLTQCFQGLQNLTGEQMGQDEAAGDDNRAGRDDDDNEQSLQDAFGQSGADAAFGDKWHGSRRDDRRPRVKRRIAEEKSVAIPDHGRVLTA